MLAEENNYVTSKMNELHFILDQKSMQKQKLDSCAFKAYFNFF